MNKIIIIGLGPGSLDQMTLEAYRLLETSPRVYMRTLRHPLIPLLEAEGVKMESFDSFYEKGETFEEVYERIAQKIIDLARSSAEPVIYAVPGHPRVAETSVEMILQKAASLKIPVEIKEGISFLDLIFSKLSIDPVNGLKVLDGAALALSDVLTNTPLIVTQLYSREIASEVKLTLMEKFPDEHPVWMVKALGVPDQEVIQEIPLYQIDRKEWIDHLTSLYVPPLAEEVKEPYQRIMAVVATLRHPEKGCPWDKEQTHESLKKYLIEESYEVLEAIEKENPEHFAEELGDLFLQIALHAQIASERGDFDINDVFNAIADKMIHRHPHVFGNETAETSAEVLGRWEEIKRKEKGMEGASVLAGITKGLPALMEAEKIQKKASKAGFDWQRRCDVHKKLFEELRELSESEAMDDAKGVAHELGDILFTIANLCRWHNVDPEEALRQCNIRFKERFTLVEEEAKRQGKRLTEYDLEELEELWQEAKAKLS